jgi:hypothetical protein
MVLVILSTWDLDAQQGFFKLPMKYSVAQAMAKMMASTTNKAHPTVVNPLTHLWRVINASQLLFHTFPKYLKLAEIAMTHILGSIEDELCFNSVSFLKDKVCNRLNPHCN